MSDVVGSVLGTLLILSFLVAWTMANDRMKG